MKESGKQKLHSLLFDGESELVNVKLFPGTGRELSAESLGAAAAEALGEAMKAWEQGEPSVAPTTGLERRPLLG